MFRAKWTGPTTTYLVSIPGQTVYRWEQILASNVLSNSREFYEVNHQMQMVKNEGPAADRMTWEVHAIRGDCTNSSVLHSSKAHACEITILFHHEEGFSGCEGEGVASSVNPGITF